MTALMTLVGIFFPWAIFFYLRRPISIIIALIFQVMPVVWLLIAYHEHIRADLIFPVAFIAWLPASAWAVCAYWQYRRKNKQEA